LKPADWCGCAGTSRRFTRLSRRVRIKADWIFRLCRNQTNNSAQTQGDATQKGNL